MSASSGYHIGDESRQENQNETPDDNEHNQNLISSFLNENMDGGGNEAGDDRENREQDNANNIVSDAFAQIANNATNELMFNEEHDTQNGNNDEHHTDFNDAGADVIADLVGGIFNDIGAAAADEEEEEEEKEEGQQEDDAQPKEGEQLHTADISEEPIQDNVFVSDSNAVDAHPQHEQNTRDFNDKKDNTEQQATQNDRTDIEGDNGNGPSEFDLSSAVNDAIANMVNETVNQISEPEPDKETRVNTEEKEDAQEEEQVKNSQRQFTKKQIAPQSKIQKRIVETQLAGPTSKDTQKDVRALQTKSRSKEPQRQLNEQEQPVRSETIVGEQSEEDLNVDDAISRMVNEAVNQIRNDDSSDIHGNFSHALSKQSQDESGTQELLESINDISIHQSSGTHGDDSINNDDDDDDDNDDDNDDDHDDMLNKAMNDAIAQLVNDAVNEVKEHTDEKDPLGYNDKPKTQENVTDRTTQQRKSDQETSAFEQRSSQGNDTALGHDYATQLLISGAVSEIIRNVSAETANASQEQEADQAEDTAAAEAAISEAVKGAIAKASELSNSGQEEKIHDNDEDLAQAAIAQIVQNVQNVVQQVPSSENKEPAGIASNQIVNKDNDFELAMNEMIRKVADEILSDDEDEDYKERQNDGDLQFAIEEMVKNVVDEAYEDNIQHSDIAATRSSLIDSLLNNSSLTSSIVSSTISKRQGEDQPKKQALDIAEELIKKRNAIAASREYSTTPNIRELLSKRASDMAASGGLSFPSSLYASSYTTTTVEKINEATARVTGRSSLAESILNQKSWAAQNLTSLLQTKTDTAPKTTPAPLTPTTLPESTAGSINASITQAVNYVLQTLMSNQQTGILVDDKERIRLDNRTRKQRWREKNNARNKDNDLRFRVHKRANVMFGETDSPEKLKWVAEEFDRRKLKRIERLRKANKDDNAINAGPSLSKRNLANTMINEGLKSFVEKAQSAAAENSSDPSKPGANFVLTSENSATLSSVISNALGSANLNVPREQFTSAITSFISNFISTNNKGSETLSKDVPVEKKNEPSSLITAFTATALPPSSAPDRELTDLIKSTALNSGSSGSSISSSGSSANYRNRANAAKQVEASVNASTSNAKKSDTPIDPTIMSMDDKSSRSDVNKGLSSIFSNISLVPSKRKASESAAVPLSKRIETSTTSSKSSTPPIKSQRTTPEAATPKTMPSFKLPVYRRSISSAVTSSAGSSALLRPGLDALKAAKAKGALVAKKPSILSSLDMQKNRPISNSGAKPRMGPSLFRRPLYRSATNS